jgi:surface antigen
MLATMTGLNEADPLNDQIAQTLQATINQIQPGVEATSIISQWHVDSEVNNTFYQGYCTYGAALISPEFFPYISKTEQQRTRGGNAIDWYLNAQLAGFPVGATPKEGSLVIYKK